MDPCNTEDTQTHQHADGIMLTLASDPMQLTSGEDLTRLLDELAQRGDHQR